MIGYITIGVSDMDKACSFYDGLLAEVGQSSCLARIESSFTVPAQGHPCWLYVFLTMNKRAPRKWQYDCYPWGDRAGVDKLYAKAIELGATDEGEPGERLPVFCGAYVRDPDGNKLCFYEMKM